MNMKNNIVKEVGFYFVIRENDSFMHISKLISVESIYIANDDEWMNMKNKKIVKEVGFYCILRERHNKCWIYISIQWWWMNDYEKQQK